MPRLTPGHLRVQEIVPPSSGGAEPDSGLASRACAPYGEVMSNQYPYAYGQPPVSSKSSVLIVALLTTVAVALAAVDFFVFPYYSDSYETSTYYEFVTHPNLEALQLDAIVVGASLVLSLLSAWIIYASARNVAATIFRVIFVLASLVAGGFSLLAIFTAGIEDGPTFIELADLDPRAGYEFGAWVFAGASVLTFLLAIVMCFVVSSYRRSIRAYNAGYGQVPPNPYQPYQQNPYG